MFSFPTGWSERDRHDDADRTYYLDTQEFIDQPLKDRVELEGEAGELARAAVL